MELRGILNLIFNCCVSSRYLNMPQHKETAFWCTKMRISQMQKKNLALNGLKWEPASLHLFPSWPLVWIWNPWDPRLRPLMKPLTSTGPLRVACSMISSPNIRRCQLEIAKFTVNSNLWTWSAKCNMRPILLVPSSWHVKFALLRPL